jgi:alpha-glucosidase
MNNDLITSGPPLPGFGRQRANPQFAWLRLPAWALILCAILCAAGNARAQENVKRIEGGVLIQFEAAQVELVAATPEALRLSVIYGRQGPAASSFLVSPGDPKATPWREVKKNGWVGIKDKLGSLLMNPKNGEWLLQNADGQVVIPQHEIGGLNQPISAAKPQIKVLVGWDKDSPIEAYGCGNGIHSLMHTEAKAGVANGQATIPYYWSKAGYAALAVTADDNHPASWRGSADGEYVTWTFPGERADLYLMPAASLKDAANAYARLTGAVPVPPLWTFGYLQSRWGWTNRAYIEDTLKNFHDFKIPVDAFIYDFEWYATHPDYSLPDQGEAGFHDFGGNPALFPELATQINAYKAQGVHFVGIRKPRLGNRALLEMARAKTWDLQSQCGEKVSARDVDFANPLLREWYIEQSADLFKAGADGWWNDEGEATYTTYFYWNLAEREALNRYRPNERLWTLNRAFSPGDHRFGAAAWTGDIVSSWEVLAATPANLLNWSLSGMPYGACDIGGFFGSPSPELMCRWMAAGVFFPIMRTHSEVHYEPHFPWLYGDDALAAMRKLIDLRYRLIPYYYSLAHETFATGVPLMRPLIMEFPDDPNVADLSDEWLMGDSLLAAPILQPGGRRSVYLPSGGWYVFGSNQMVQGGCSRQVVAALDEIPVYIRMGTILPLGPVVQHTSDLPGGPLELQVYPGADATFTLVEDDGESQDYLAGKTRRTTFHWDDAKRQLSWRQKGDYSGKNVFQKVRVVVLAPKARAEAGFMLSPSGAVKPL